jgi:O-antigen/teichoic acid export membrane protein
VAKGWRGLPLVARLRALAQASPWWELALRSGSVLLVRVAGAGLGFAFNVALARVLGAQGLGVYHLCLTFAMLKFSAAGYATADAERLAAVHRMGITTALLGCGMVAASTFWAADWLALKVYADPAIAQPLRLMALALVPFAVLSLYGELLKAGQHQALSSFVQGAALPIVNLLLLFCFAADIKGAQAAAWVYLASTLSVCLTGFLLWRRTLPRARSASTTPLSLRQLLGTAMPMYGSAIADVVMTFADVLILGLFATASEVGIYTAAARTALLTRFLLLANSSVAAPRFAALHAANDREGVARLALRSTWLTTISSLPLLLIFMIFPAPILSVFGPQFEAGAQALLILSLGQFVNAATGPVGYLLNMSGYHRIEGRIAVVGAVLTVALCFALIPLWGILGAAAANAIATASCNLLRVYYAHTCLGILMLPIPQRFRTRRR